MSLWSEAAAQIWAGWMWPMMWQMTLLILLIAVIDRLIRKWAWPQLRLALWSLVLLKLVLPPTLTSPVSLTSMFFTTHAVPHGMERFAGTGSIIEEPIPATAALSVDVDLLDSPAGTFRASPAIVVPPIRLYEPRWPAFIILTWLSGIAVLTACVLFRVHALWRVVLAGRREIAPPPWFGDILGRVTARVGLHRPPRIVFSDRVHGPAVFGLHRPVLLLPTDAFETLSRSEVEHVLMHELAHIKRGDLLLHAATVTIQIVYWFHPLVWFLRRKLHDLRELCCDATVADLLRDATEEYRDTLLRSVRRMLARSPEPGLRLLGLFEESNTTIARLRWLEHKTWRFARLRRATIILVSVAMLLFVLPMARTTRRQSMAEAYVARAALAERVLQNRRTITMSPVVPAVSASLAAQAISSLADQICAAASAGRLDSVKEVLNMCPLQLDARAPGPYTRSQRYSPLHHAAASGSQELVEFLLSKGVDINSVNADHGWTPVQYAVDQNKTDLARWMIQRGARVDIFVAAGLGDIDAVRRFVHDDPGLAAQAGPAGQTPLHFAATAEVAAFLLDHGADLHALDKVWQATPIRCQASRLDVARVLAKRGAFVDVFVAAAIDDLERLAQLLDADPSLIGARTSEDDVLGPNNTPLRIAAAMNRTRAARQLIARGADLHARGGIAQATPLHVAAWNGRVDVARLLIESGADIEALDNPNQRRTPLVWAVIMGHQDVVELLLDHGARITDQVMSHARDGAEGNLRTYSSAKPEAFAPILEILRKHQAMAEQRDVRKSRPFRFIV